MDFAPLLPVRVVDAYADGEGSLRAKLLSALTVSAAAPSPGVNESELLRYLAESVWVPTALLPGAGVEWEAIDDESARATLQDGETTASLVFYFEGDEVRRVPTEAEVEWTLPDGDQPYWRGEVEAVTYDPESAS